MCKENPVISIKIGDIWQAKYLSDSISNVLPGASLTSGWQRDTSRRHSKCHPYLMSNFRIRAHQNKTFLGFFPKLPCLLLEELCYQWCADRSATDHNLQIPMKKYDRSLQSAVSCCRSQKLITCISDFTTCRSQCSISLLLLHTA